MEVLVNPDMLPLYLIGFVTCIANFMDHWLNAKRIIKPFAWYVQDFLYTVISIIGGIFVCTYLETSQGTMLGVSIATGLLGSTIIRKIRHQKDTLADTFIEKIKEKINSKK